MNVIEGLIEQSGACFDCFPVAGYEKDEIEKIALYLIAHGVTVQGWISVTDRLPDDNTPVVCLIGDTDCPEYDILRWDNTDYRWDNGVEWFYKDEITHWMPLPQPPKGE